MKFVALGAAHLIIAVRSVSRGENAARIIKSRCAPSTCDIDVWELDMATYSSVRSFAERVGRELGRLDIVVLNAGVFMPSLSTSEHGWEETLQINTLSTTLLALLLLPHLRRLRAVDRATAPILEIVSSGLHRRTNLLTPEQQQTDAGLLDLFNPLQPYNGNKQYAVSKLFLMCALPVLADKGNSEAVSQVRVVSVCPGACSTQLARGYNSWFASFAKWLAGLLFLRSAEAGSRTLVSGALLGAEAQGGFWQHDELLP